MKSEKVIHSFIHSSVIWIWIYLFGGGKRWDEWGGWKNMEWENVHLNDEQKSLDVSDDIALRESWSLLANDSI